MCPVSVRYEDLSDENCHKRNQSLRLPEDEEELCLFDEAMQNLSEDPIEAQKRYSLTYSKTVRYNKALPIGSQGVECKDGKEEMEEKKVNEEEWVKNIRSSKKFYDVSCDKKAKELKKKLSEMEKQHKIKRNKEQLYSESSPKINIEHLKLLNKKSKRNAPLHSTKLLLQQEKLKSYQEALKAKMSSLKASNNKKAKEYELYESEAINGNMDVLRSSFHLKMQKLNAKLYKYKNETSNKKESKLDNYEDVNTVKSVGAPNIKLKCDRRSAIINKENQP
jgi:hypothetical protein